MNDAFGEWVVARAFGAIDQEVATARRSGLLRAAPIIGITAAPTVAAAVPVRQNTFFGRDER
jgi:hypothetical protein